MSRSSDTCVLQLLQLLVFGCALPMRVSYTFRLSPLLSCLRLPEVNADVTHMMKSPRTFPFCFKMKEPNTDLLCNSGIGATIFVLCERHSFDSSFFFRRAKALVNKVVEDAGGATSMPVRPMITRL